MKLMPRAEVNAKSTQEESGAILRIQDIRKLEYDWRLKLGKAEKEFQETLAKNSKEWEAEYAEHIAHVAKMKEEIATLEEKRRLLLAPINVIRKMAEEKIKQAEDMLISVNEKEQETDKLSELLQEKLDNLGERESDIATKESRLSVREQNAIDRESAVADGQKELTEAIKQFGIKSSKRDAELNARQTTIVLHEREIASKLESIERKEALLEKEAIYLKDQRGVLQRAFDEVRSREQAIPPAK